MNDKVIDRLAYELVGGTGGHPVRRGNIGIYLFLLRRVLANKIRYEGLKTPNSSPPVSVNIVMLYIAI